jgi:hypothetical protein
MKIPGPAACLRTLTALRFDPSAGLGEVVIEWIRITDSEGALLQE